MGGREVLGVKSCLIGISNDKNNICHRPQISYCKSANQGLNQAYLRQK